MDSDLGVKMGKRPKERQQPAVSGMSLQPQEGNAIASCGFVGTHGSHTVRCSELGRQGPASGSQRPVGTCLAWNKGAPFIPPSQSVLVVSHLVPTSFFFFFFLISLSF